MDSFNMLVPETCSGTNAAGQTVRAQYEEQRGVLAFDDSKGEYDMTIDATGQPCEKFALHDELTVLKELYDDNDLIFFANTGVINENGMTKTNYKQKTTTQLFAHNTMQQEAKVVDPYRTAPGTGVLGRAKDLLSTASYGHVVNSLSIDIASIAINGAAEI